jgi:Protein of unknown function (DUF4232)
MTNRSRLAVLLVLVLTGPGTLGAACTGHPVHAVRSAVPTTTRVPPSAQPASHSAPRQHRVAACQASDVSASFGRTGAAMGTWTITVRFHNVSASPCLLTGYATVTFSAPRLPTIVATHDPARVSSTPMAPGGSTWLRLEYQDSCHPPASDRYEQMAIAVPGGGHLMLRPPEPLGAIVPCDVWVTPFYTT